MKEAMMKSMKRNEASDRSRLIIRRSLLVARLVAH